MFGKTKKYCFFLFVVVVLLRVGEYISEGKGAFLVNPDPNLLTQSENMPSRVLLLIQVLLIFLNKI